MFRDPEVHRIKTSPNMPWWKSGVGGGRFLKISLQETRNKIEHVCDKTGSRKMG